MTRIVRLIRLVKLYKAAIQKESFGIKQLNENFEQYKQIKQQIISYFENQKDITSRDDSEKTSMHR